MDSAMTTATAECNVAITNAFTITEANQGHWLLASGQQ